MKKLLIAATVILLPLFVGCVHSLNSAYTPEAGVFDEALIGSWSAEDGEDLWEFDSIDDEHYRFTLTDVDGLEGLFDVGMFEVDGVRFLDFYPAYEEGDESAENVFYTYHFLPMHTFMTVDIVDGVLQLGMLDPQWAEDYLVQNPEAVEHSWSDFLLLTDDAEGLQEFLLAASEVDGAFSVGAPLSKMK